MPEKTADETRRSIVEYLRSEAERFRKYSDHHDFTGAQKERVSVKATQIDECATCIERRMDENPR